MENILRDLNLTEFTLRIRRENILREDFATLNDANQPQAVALRSILRHKVGLISSQILKICDRAAKTLKMPTPSYSDLSRSYQGPSHPLPQQFYQQTSRVTQAAFKNRAGGSRRTQMMIGKSQQSSFGVSK